MQHQAIPDLVAYLSETIEEIETHGADTKTEEHVYAKKDDFFLMILKRNDRLLAQLCDPSTDFEILELSVGIETYNEYVSWKAMIGICLNTFIYIAVVRLKMSIQNLKCNCFLFLDALLGAFL